MPNVASPAMPLADAEREAAPVRAAAGEIDNGSKIPGHVAELRVSGHLMTLDTGLFCVFQAPGGPVPDPASGLPGVRISLPPGLNGQSDAVSISSFRQDGWLSGAAALVRVTDGPGQVLVTVYQSAKQSAENAPRLQVLRLSADPTDGSAAPAAAPPAAGQPLADPDVVAHVQRTGDVGARFGDWIGTRGSKLWIEGFGLASRNGLPPESIEYQAVLGRGWLSPWVESGKFCGSRGMALPLLGLKIRLKGEAAKQYDCAYSATFTDGSAIGPVVAGESCEAESLAALESFRIEFNPKTGNTPSRGPTARAAKPAPAAVAVRTAKPAPGKARTGKAR
jgi:hypothetical protein